MNTVYPRQLWLLTVNHLTPPPNISQEDLALDPLAVLRCDDRVFRTAPLLSILLYMLKACLAASRSRLCQYLQDQPPPGANTSLAETEREELKEFLGVDPGERGHPNSLGDLSAWSGRGGGSRKSLCFARNSEPCMLLSSSGESLIYDRWIKLEPYF